MEHPSKKTLHSSPFTLLLSLQGMIRDTIKILTLLLGVSIVLACSGPGPDEVLAVLADQKITVGDLQKELLQEKGNYPKRAYSNSNTFFKIKKKLLDEKVDHYLLLGEAKKQGTTVQDAELQQEVQRYKSLYTEVAFQNMLQEVGISPADWVKKKKENLIVKKYLDHITAMSSPVTAEKIEAYYKEHKDEFKVPESVHVRQIVTDSKEKAESILRRLRNGENFAKLARDLSLSPDRKKGGDLGFIPKGTFPREFEVCFTMNPGEISPIIPSAYGFHLFKVLEKAPERTLGLEEVEAKIALHLKQQARQAGREGLLKDLHAQTKIEINQDLLERLSL